MSQPAGFPELACYGLAGHSDSPRDLIAEAQCAEAWGVGSMFLSERFNSKDAGVMAGVVAASSTRLGIATAATNHNTRHPLVTATMAMTAHRVSGGRYTLGLGRGFGMLFDLMGLPRVTGAQLRDTAEILRTLWAGGAVVDHHGPAGDFAYLQQSADFEERIPIAMVAIGDNTLRLAGEIADAVILHTYLGDEALARSVALVRGSAEQAGRDPDSVRIWSVLGTVPDTLDEATRLRRTVGRLSTYLQGYGDVLVQANGWRRADLDRFRSHDLVQGYPGAFDAVGTIEELSRLRDEALPAHWLDAAATGTPQACAARVGDQFAAGADSVVLHGCPPQDLVPVLEAWPGVRDTVSADLDALPVNPGWMR